MLTSPMRTAAGRGGIVVFILALCSAHGSAVSAAGWSLEGSLSQAAFRHTATLLPNGKVLVVGGLNVSGVLSRAELYDPTNGAWAPTGQLGRARESHTTTLLPNGKVLVAGGVDVSGVLRSAELYDPSTGTWRATGDLNVARSEHTATLLPNGRVLVTAGLPNALFNGRTNASELYDPATGVWTSTGFLKTPRSRATATLLPNGKVLVAGGSGFTSETVNPPCCHVLLASVEIYDPATGAWASTGNLNSTRSGGTATLLPNGKVLVAGFGSSTELYDPSTGTWTPTGPLNAARSGHTTTLLPNGKVLIAGGAGNGGMLSSVELYDPLTGVWMPTSNLNVARSGHTAILLPHGKVLIKGGVGGSSAALSSAELYDFASASWVNTGSLGTRRANHTATLLASGKLLVAGGFNRPSIALQTQSSSELYDHVSGTWSSTGSLNASRHSHTATLLGSGKVLVAGGLGRSSAELYDPGPGTWTVTGSLGVVRARHTATLLGNGKVLVAGGVDNAIALASAELYDPLTGSWTPTAGNLGAARSDHTATLMRDGRVLIAGGRSGVTALTSAAIYDPPSGSWTAIGNLAGARSDHSSTLLSDGGVLIAGGFNGSTYLSSGEIYYSGVGWIGAAGLVTAANLHTATTLLNGTVIFAGGSNGAAANPTALNSATLFDPKVGSQPAASLTTARFIHTATLLPNGKVLIVGGFDGNFYLNGAELYDPGLGFTDPQWRPALTRVSLPVAPGGPVVATGSFFRGIGEAASGGTSSASSDNPVMQLRRLDNEQTITLLTSSGGWSNTTFNGALPPGFNPGPAIVTIFTNGIPSLARSTVVQIAALSPASQSFAASGGSNAFTLALPLTTVWNAVVNDPWIHITSPAIGTGPATVSFLVDAHSSLTPRSGTISVAGETFTVRQGAQFGDVSQADLFYSFIGKLSARGITQGCSVGLYCPTAPVTRSQMAVFLERALRGDAFVPPPATCVNGHTNNFIDVPCPGFFADYIEQLRADGVTLGCRTSEYCPNDAVTRAQMAIFIERDLGNFIPPLALAQRFADVPMTHFAHPFVEDLAARAITLGCVTALYCPDQQVTREQMAAFLVRAFGL